MRTVMMLMGLPASGKSTFAKELLRKEPKRWKRVNRDDLRALLDGENFIKENEEFVRNAQEVLIKEALRQGFDVVIDNTHLIASTVNKLHKLIESVGDVKVIHKAFNVSVDECLERNAKREGRARVPDNVILGMAKGAGLNKGRKLQDKEFYYPPRGSDVSTVTNDPALPKAIICDLDGTLAIMGDRSPYDASECDVKDHPNWPVIECVKAMYRQGVHIIFMSGRESKDRDATRRFIDQWVTYTVTSNVSGGRPPYEAPISYELHMRQTGDQRKDAIIKRELFQANVEGKYHVMFILDDRNQVVHAWRLAGLTVFQVAEGDF
jgi:predicted kinase